MVWQLSTKQIILLGYIICHSKKDGNSQSTFQATVPLLEIIFWAQSAPLWDIKRRRKNSFLTCGEFGFQTPLYNSIISQEGAKLLFCKELDGSLQTEAANFPAHSSIIDWSVVGGEVENRKVHFLTLLVRNLIAPAISYTVRVRCLFSIPKRNGQNGSENSFISKQKSGVFVRKD